MPVLLLLIPILLLLIKILVSNTGFPAYHTHFVAFDADIDDRTDITTAINSLSVDLATLDSNSVLNTNTIGSLRLLDSDGFVGDERTKVVNALNALRADIPKIFDESGTQLN